MAGRRPKTRIRLISAEERSPAETTVLSVTLNPFLLKCSTADAGTTIVLSPHMDAGQTSEVGITPEPINGRIEVLGRGKLKTHMVAVGPKPRVPAAGFLGG